MKKLMISALFVFTLAACDKKDSSDTVAPNELSGNYVGTFHRTNMGTSQVMLSFINNSFSGSSSVEKYPALCHGSFLLNSPNITFTDSCTWTADFDWTLILNGTYNISFLDERNVRIWRDNGTVTDEYLLHIPTR